MTKYELLLQEASIKGVEVYENYDLGRLEGLYVDGAVALSPSIETSARKVCVLAEELGHHETSAGNILNLGDVGNLKQEHKARVWAFQKLVPVDDIAVALAAGCGEIYQMAEFLGVDEEFLRDCLIHYRFISE